MALKFFSSFLLGLYNSFNVFNFSVIILLLVVNDYLVVYRGGKGKFFIYSVLFVFLIGNFCWVVGLFEFFANKFFVTLLEYVLLALMGVFFVWGILNLKDWAAFKKNKDSFKFKVWPILVVDQGVKKLRKIWLFFIAVLLGFVLSFLTVLWPQDYYLYVLNRDVVVGNQLSIAYGAFFCYALGFIVPVVFVSELWVWLSHRQKSEKFVSLVKISWASFFLAVSISMGFVIYRMSLNF